MARYIVVGIPLEPSPVSGHRVGDVVDLDLSSADEKAWTGAGAIRRLPDPKPDPEPEPKPEPQKASSGSDEQDS